MAPWPGQKSKGLRDQGIHQGRMNSLEHQDQDRQRDMVESASDQLSGKLSISQCPAHRISSWSRLPDPWQPQLLLFECQIKFIIKLSSFTSWQLIQHELKFGWARCRVLRNLGWWLRSWFMVLGVFILSLSHITTGATQKFMVYVATTDFFQIIQGSRFSTVHTLDLVVVLWQLRSDLVLEDIAVSPLPLLGHFLIAFHLQNGGQVC